MDLNEVDHESSDDEATKLFYKLPKRPVIESVHVQGRTPEFRVPESQLASLVKDQFFPDRTLFKYSPLRKGYIRLIVLRRGKPNDPIECDLHTVRLSKDKRPYYDALSYEWGDTPPNRQIKLRDFTTRLKSGVDAGGNSGSILRSLVLRRVGVKFFVRENLFQALRHFRQEYAEVRLWNDAICINQEDDKEKEGQIAMMADIYSNAHQVTVWLGGKSQKSDIAMDFVREVVEFELHQSILQRPDAFKKWDALHELLRSRWFSRRWIVQEIALARSALVFCGEKVVHWDDLSDAISIFKDRHEEVQRAFRQQSGFLKVESEMSLTAVQAMGAIVLVTALTELLTKSDKGEILARRLPLDYLVSNLVSFDMKDPRDTVFALLAIATSNPEKELKPSPSKSLLDVYTEFLKYCYQHSNSLDMICRYWAPCRTTLPPTASKSLIKRLKTQDAILPSWIKKLDESAFGTPERIFRGRKNADSLVGDDPRYPHYNACGPLKSHPTAIFGQTSPPFTQDEASKNTFIERFDGTLTVRGFILGRVKIVSWRFISGIIPQEALKMAGWNYSLKDENLPTSKIPDKLWRTLVAGRHEGDGRSSPNCFRDTQSHVANRADGYRVAYGGRLLAWRIYSCFKASTVEEELSHAASSTH
jgi:hypothetical protein